LAPEQTDAELDGLGDSSVSVGDGSTTSVGPGPVEAEALGASLGGTLGPTLGSTLGSVLGERLGGWLAVPGVVGGVCGVPRPHPDRTSSPAARSRGSRTVPAVRERKGVTRQA
jgi:phage tail tape-measure protein